MPLYRKNRRNIAGNMLSRFTDFLTTDGEKGWRNRDAEFTNSFLNKTEMMNYWNKGWECLLTTLEQLSEKDLEKIERELALNQIDILQYTNLDNTQILQIQQSKAKKEIWEKSKETTTKCIQLVEQIILHYTLIYNLLTQAYHLKGDIEKTKKYALLAQKLGNDLPSTKQIATTYQLLYQIAEQEQDFKKALLFHKKYSKATQHYLDEAQSKQLAFQLVDVAITTRAGK